MSDGFRVTGNSGGDSSTQSRRLSKEDLRTKEEEQGTWEGKATMDIILALPLTDQKQVHIVLSVIFT